MTEAELIKAQDKERTKRAFVQFVGTALGVDQTITGEDGSVYHSAGGYWSVNPQSGAAAPTVPNRFVITPDHMLIGGLVIFALFAFTSAKS